MGDKIAVILYRGRHAVNTEHGWPTRRPHRRVARCRRLRSSNAASRPSPRCWLVHRPRRSRLLRGLAPAAARSAWAASSLLPGLPGVGAGRRPGRRDRGRPAAGSAQRRSLAAAVVIVAGAVMARGCRPVVGAPVTARSAMRAAEASASRSATRWQALRVPGPAAQTSSAALVDPPRVRHRGPITSRAGRHGPVSVISACSETPNRRRCRRPCTPAGPHHPRARRRPPPDRTAL